MARVFTRYFRYGRHEDTGYSGQILQRRGPRGWEPCPTMYPAGGDFAHDTLEHFSPPTDDDHIINEALAFGAIWWGRVDTNWMMYQGRPKVGEADWLLASVPDPVQDGLSGEFELPEAPRVQLSEQAEDLYAEMLGMVRGKWGQRALVREYNYFENPKTIIDYAARFLGWMRVGHDRASSRWGPRDWDLSERQHEFAHMYWNMRETWALKKVPEETYAVKVWVDPVNFAFQAFTQESPEDEWWSVAKYNL